ncbi:hypothetical protein KUTeg_008462 [Tegillarca granosa]|uniref:Uncharacterized protein n=1 Tax=Tegillarca granosa TaxID=220873 RepID=A0ABQ9FCF9_TEGGR|nr:hypothetical protein KUTeg_008462 [Tegillarca granosa]
MASSHPTTDFVNQVEEYLRFADVLIQECKKLDAITGMKKLEKKCLSEVRFLNLSCVVKLFGWTQVWSNGLSCADHLMKTNIQLQPYYKTVFFLKILNYHALFCLGDICSNQEVMFKVFTFKSKDGSPLLEDQTLVKNMRQLQLFNGFNKLLSWKPKIT